MKEVLRNVFLRTLAQLALDRRIRDKVSASHSRLQVGNERVDLKLYRKIFVVAFGKAAYGMVETTADILRGWPLGGVISGLGRNGYKRAGFASFCGGHPFPNSESFRAGDAVVQLLRSVTAGDFVLYLLSGGGSALCEKPLLAEISADDCREFHRLLVTCGANILDVNVLRKHLSAVKGGRLSALAYPARQLTLYVSDAPPGHPSNVASGPTMPDESTAEDCYQIAARWDLESRLPAALRRVFQERRIPETPKPGAPAFRANSWHCLLTPEDAVSALAEEVRKQGWVVETDLSVRDDCPLESAARHLLSRVETLRQRHPGRTVAVVNGGEYSCPAAGKGTGGRNQAFVLECVPKIAGRNIAVLSAGTDGLDGTSPAAGAVADDKTWLRAVQLDLDPAGYARNSDSYGFFSRLGDALITGPTNNNVRDLRVLVAR